jgi:predicted N-acyltransferase
MNVIKKQEFHLSWKNRMASIDRNQWDNIAHNLKTPFLEWDWLHQMEVSGSIIEKTGWIPNHLTVWSGKKLVAGAPLYIKIHSEGEFVYDYAWADIASRLGIQYYPKMVGMSPVTPVMGYRFLIAPGIDEAKMTRLMVNSIDHFCIEHRLSGSHFLFVEPDWKDLLEPLGYNSWAHQSFIWKNRGFKSFDDYLAQFNSNQRRNIRREQIAMEKQGFLLKTYSGDDIPMNFLSLMYTYYVNTNDKFGPWGCKYLTGDFFKGLYDTYRHRLVMVSGFEKPNRKTPSGMALFVVKKDQLYGRYWGCHKKFDALHFNICYYQPIQWAIKHGIQNYNPGAGGNHKVRRGFQSVPSYSLLRFYHPKLQNVMVRHINEINRLEKEEIDQMNLKLPFVSPLKRK